MRNNSSIHSNSTQWYRVRLITRAAVLQSWGGQRIQPRFLVCLGRISSKAYTRHPTTHSKSWPNSLWQGPNVRMKQPLGSDPSITA